jgi:hypothetical protein
MSYSDYIDFLIKNGTARTEDSNGEIALNKQNTINSLMILADTNVAVLGGDIYEVEDDGYFRPTYDNWYYDKNRDDEVTFAKRSQNFARKFIQDYEEKEGKKTMYVLVIKPLNKYGRMADDS